MDILVLDDEKEITELVELYLRNEGFQAVSYTHLDVYKRQAHTLVQAANVLLLLGILVGFRICLLYTSRCV